LKPLVSFFLFFLFNFVCFAQNEKQISFRNLTVDNGLSQNSIVSMTQDQTGFMWFATQDGLNKYDGRHFQYFPYQFEDVTRNTYSKLGKVFIDNEDVVWIITNSGILHKENKASKKFEQIKNLENISVLIQDASNNYYLGTYDSGIYRISYETKDTLQILKPSDIPLTTYDLFPYKNFVLAATSGGIIRIFENNSYEFIEVVPGTNFSSFTHSTTQNKLYLGSYGNGLYVADESMHFRAFTGFENVKLPANLIIQDILIDSRDKLWIATYGKGAYLIDFEKEIIQNFVANKANPYALHYNDVLSLYEDFTGTVWLGTDGSGLSYYDEYLVKFNVLTNKQVPNDFNIDFVRAISKKDGKIWLGTSNLGLTSVDFKTKEYQTHTTSNSNLASNRIMSLYSNSTGLWIGHQNHGLQKMTGNNHFKTFEATQGMSVWKIYDAKNGNLWLCTLYGLFLFNEKEGIIKTYNEKNINLFSSGIRTVESGKENELWIGTEAEGLYLLNTESDQITKIKEVPDRIKSLFYHNGILWIGTNGNGLKAYNSETKKIKHFTTEQGLANNVIYGILPDEKNNFWLSSNKGLTMATMVGDSIVSLENFTSYDGLQTNEFNTGAYYKDANGTLYFGGLEGLNWFNPNDLSFSPIKPKTIISQFKIHSQPVSLQDSQKFNSKENTVTFAFSSLHFSLPERNQYRYILENYDSDWIESGNINSAHYTNLPPGKYTFKVLSSNYDGIWSEIPATFSFRILKPWYLSYVAWGFYLLVFGLLGYFVYRYFKWRWQVKMQLEMEYRERERLEKLNQLKTKLFNNISHEFRTPLTLISGPVENQLKRPDNSEDDHLELNLIKRNSKRLLNLINQMLDMAKLETGHVQLKISPGNLNSFLHQLIGNFEYKAKQKKIDFNYQINGLEEVWFDKELTEKVFTNLIGNAVKFAPENGFLEISAIETKGWFNCIIINNGNQLSEEEVPHIFDRFYSGKHNRDRIGIGLSLVKELVLLAKGTIQVQSPKKDEIAFLLEFPVSKESFDPTEIEIAYTTQKQDERSYPNINSEKQTESGTGKTEKLPKLLLVEDDFDMRLFIKSVLKNNYSIIEAENGLEGIQKTLENFPEVIISDIMMPAKSGIELCNELKFNEQTSHIPILLLTAKVGDKNEIEGLRAGADDYITKPFNEEILKLKIGNLLKSRDRLKEIYSQTLNLSPELYVTSTEQEFLERLEKTTQEHLTNPSLSSEEFSRLMGMSRSQLHKKLYAVLGVSTSEFIRSQRLKMAKELLKSQRNVSEISYLVGFNTPSYFSKCFKETFGCTPAEFQQDSL
jgi:signal transduction histidine kinase/ligand-binding sensor domain-containing protein/DNA-binding response OmpR family regulator